MNFEERSAELNKRAVENERRIEKQLTALAGSIRDEIEFAIPNCAGEIVVKLHGNNGFEIGVSDGEEGVVFGTSTEMYLSDRMEYDQTRDEATTVYELKLQKGSVGSVGPKDRAHLLADRIKGLLAGWMFDEIPHIVEIQRALISVYEATSVINREYRKLEREVQAEQKRKSDLELQGIIDSFEVGTNYILPEDGSQYFEITRCGSEKVTISGSFMWRTTNRKYNRDERRNTKSLAIRDLALHIRNKGWKVSTLEYLHELQGS